VHEVYKREMTNAIVEAITVNERSIRPDPLDVVVMRAFDEYWKNRRAFVMEAEDVEINLQHHFFGPNTQVSNELTTKILDRIEAVTDGKIPWERLILPAYVNAITQRD